MRASGLLFLLLIVFAAIIYPERTSRLLHAVVSESSEPVEAPLPAGLPNGREWRYAETSQFHAVLPEEVQEFRSPDPERTAARVCGSLGGAAAFVESEAVTKRTLNFLCRFEEPDVTMSVDFGELRRIRGNP